MLRSHIHTDSVRICYSDEWSLKRSSHVKVMLANSCWQTQIGVCERRNNMLANCWEKVGENRDKFYLSPTVYQHVVVSFTHTNLSLPSRVNQH